MIPSELFSDSLFVAGRVQRATAARKEDLTQTLVIPALTHLVGPSSLYLD